MMLKKIFSRILFFVILSFELFSCNSNEVYNSFVSLPQKGWGNDSLAVFKADITDASNAYNIWIMLRNENDYPYANLWLFIDAISPNGQMTRDTLECILAHPDGAWIGGGWGSLYTLQCPYRLNAHFIEQGQYTFRVMHGMRDDEIKGIHDIGLRIEKK